MYTIVTGAAGFIGSNLVKALNERGESQIIAVDNLTRADKFSNLVDCQIADYLDKDEFIARLAAGRFDGDVAAVGADRGAGEEAGDGKGEAAH